MGTGAENIALIRKLGGMVDEGGCISYNAAILCAEIERLTADNANLRANLRGHTMYHSDEEVNTEMGRLRAEVERLAGQNSHFRDALTRIINTDACCLLIAEEMQEIAKEALAESVCP